jgi:endonuclease VIII
MGSGSKAACRPDALHIDQSHLGMTGSWQVYRRGERWRKPQRAAWLLLEGGQMDAVQFGGPALRIVPARALDRDPVLARLGPDILAADFDVEAVSRSLRSAGDRPIGEALLDQSAVAGIGNIFKSEACFAARVDPWRPVSGLSQEALESVLTHARSLMLDAVAGGRRPRTVYRQTGRPCPRCGTRILARGQGDDNRSTELVPRLLGRRIPSGRGGLNYLRARLIRRPHRLGRRPPSRSGGRSAVRPTNRS